MASSKPLGFAFARCCFWWAVPVALADAPAQRARGDAVIPPMVIDDRGRLTGFSIDLWNAIADKLKLQTEYKVTPDVGALLEETSLGKADLGISAISITAERDRQFDFSQPMLEAGLQILVRGGRRRHRPIRCSSSCAFLTSPTIAV